MPGLARKNKKSLDARSGEGAEPKLRCGLRFLSVTEAGTLEGPQPQ